MLGGRPLIQYLAAVPDALRRAARLLMVVLKEIGPCREAVRDARRGRGAVGLVPTMGALHKGHMSLIRASVEQCAFTAVSIFVNPTQFGPAADFEGYPRMLDADLAACESAGVDLVFAPSVLAMYPAGVKTTVHLNGVTDGLCGPGRPGHFDGVATVVSKLFNILPADLALFGEKDYQQLVVIRRMVRDLSIPIEIVGWPTVREPDGLACSSRNAYLSAGERKQASCLSSALFTAVDRIAAGKRDAAPIIGAIREEIVAAGPAEIEYVDIVDANTLDVMSIIDRPARICLAVRIGSCRLIDNVPVEGKVETSKRRNIET